MKDAKSKKIVMVLLVLLILCFIAIAVILIFSLKNPKLSNVNSEVVNNPIDVNNDTVRQEAPKLYTDTSINEINDTSLLLAVQNCINVYFQYNFSENSKGLYEILDKDYIEKNGITESNVLNNIGKVNKNTKIFVKNAYEKEISFDCEYRYYVYGQLYSDDYTQSGEAMFVVNLDLLNYSFSLIPYEITTKEEFNNYMNELISKDDGGQVEAGQTSTGSIALNDFNSFNLLEYNQLTNEAIQNYYKYYYFLQVNNQTEAYKLLDENFRANRFKSQEVYYNYIKDKSDTLNLKYIKQYVENEKNYYIGITEKGTYFIIIESSPMKFSVMLDSYTTPLSETTTKYNSVSEQEKACMCLELVKEMINNGDYETIYSHLNDTFKSNNFKSLDEFKKYMQGKYFECSKFSYESYSVLNDNYVIKVKVSNNENEEDNFSINYIVKLGTAINDFEMSFNIE